MAKINNRMNFHTIAAINTKTNKKGVREDYDPSPA